MLNGLDPIILIHLSKRTDVTALTGVTGLIPIVSSAIDDLIDFPPIPIYLSENLFGIVIDAESKNVDIVTDFETKTDGTLVNVNQKGANSSVSVNLTGKKDSIPITLLSAFIDLIFSKVTSKEYSITYLHGATTIFRGLLKSFAIDQVEGTDKLSIKLELTTGESKPQKGPTVPSPTPQANTILAPRG
jgi:hypothetical protein